MAEEVFIVTEKVEKRFIMKPQPVTYSAKELKMFLTALSYKWRIVPTPSGATIGVCPEALSDDSICYWLPPDIRDEFIALFLKT